MSADPNPKGFTWWESQPNPDGSIDVYAGVGDQTLDQFRKFQDRTHGHFVVGANNEDTFGRSGPNGSPPDYRNR